MIDSLLPNVVMFLALIGAFAIYKAIVESFVGWLSKRQ